MSCSNAKEELGDEDAAISSSLLQTAVAAEESTDYEAAVGHYRNLLEKNPEDIYFFLGVARNLRYAGASKDGLNFLASAEAEHRETVPFLLEKGKMQIAVGDNLGAVKTLRRVAEKDPERWEAYSAIGVANDMAGNFDAALEAYEKALKISPGNAAVINNMALSAALSGDLRRAISILEEVPSALRDNMQLRQNLALFYGILGDSDRAESLLRRDLEYDAVRNNLSVIAKIRGERPPLGN